MENKDNLFRKANLVVFTRKRGKIILTLEALGVAQLKGYLLTHALSIHQDAIIFYQDNGEIYWYVEGTDNFMPTITEGDEHNVEYYIPGILEWIKAN